MPGGPTIAVYGGAMSRSGGWFGALADTWPKQRLERLSGPMTMPLTVVALSAFVAASIEAAVLVIVAKVATDLASGLTGLGAGRGTIGPVDLSGVSSGTLLVVGFLLVGAYLITEITSGWAIARLLSRTIYGSRRTVLERHAAAPWAAKESLEGAALVQLATMNVGKGANTVTEMAGIISAGINFVILILAALVIDPIAALLVAGGVIALLVLSLPLAAVARRQHRYMADLNTRYASIVQEHSALSREIEVFGVQHESLEPIDDLNRRHTGVIFRSRWLAKINTAIFKASGLVLILTLLAVAVAAETDDIATFASVALILLRSVSYGQAAQKAWHGLGESAAWLDQLDARVIDLRPAHDTTVAAVAGPTTALEIEFDDVSFNYPSGPPVLDHLRCRIPAGSFVGVVGVSGAGKSTLAELLLGLRTPVEGTLRLDGHDRTTLHSGDWSRSIAFVPQEPVLRRGSIIENVRFHRDWVTDDAVVAALADAHVLDDVLAWPDGLDTDPGTLGSRLSGGQKQRIAIARALAGRPRLLLLDEPTSALDAAAEQRVAETIAALAGDMTVVVIAHRLSTLTRCDALIALDDGRIAAYGPPDQVMAAIGPS